MLKDQVTSFEANWLPKGSLIGWSSAGRLQRLVASNHSRVAELLLADTIIRVIPRHGRLVGLLKFLNEQGTPVLGLSWDEAIVLTA